MKYLKNKFWILAAVLCLTVLCSACGSFVSILPGTAASEADDQTALQEGDQSDKNFSERPLFTFLGWESWGDDYYTDTPVALSVQYNGGCISPLFDRASIIAACDALREMTVTGRAQETEGQSQQVFTFTMSDGKEYELSFTDGVLSTYTGTYTVSGGEELWNIVFPAYNSSYDLFDLYFDDSIRAFADNFYENTPVSVGRRSNGGATLISEDPEVVEQAFQLLANATVTVVENRPDQNIDLTQTQDYIFYMEDGSYYTFSFAQQCLAVRASSVYGTVYYWMSGLDELFSMTIAPEDENGKFEGGSIAGLRSDIQEAYEIANGQSDELTIAGVYVDYTIDGESGYLTLSGDDAYDLVRQATSITATSETVSDPEGERITISVTLSDWSGPIIYFTGDTIQQVVGINYVCDSSAMSSLRSTILSLAADGHNTAQIDEGTTE
jgi:hypothetical protein